VEDALKEIMEAAVSANREGAAAEALSRSEIKSTIKMAIESESKAK
jgi:hypothetical protein